MGYRLLVVLCAVFLISGCAAFDHDNEPYEGFSPDEVPVFPGADLGVHNGYYSGTMTLDSNTCAGVSDEVNAAIPMSLDVIHLGTTMNITFEDSTVASGELSGDDNSIFMIQTGTTKHVYYLAFSDAEETVTGSCEVIEIDDNGQYSHPCASYTVSLLKGEKPAEDEVAEAADEEESEGDDSGGIDIPLETSKY